MNLFRLSLVGALSLSSSLVFADTTWISTSSSSWATAGNWSSGTPGGGVGAVFQDGASIQTFLDTGANPQITAGILYNLVAGGNAFTIGSTLTPSGINVRAGNVNNGGILNNDDNTQIFNVPLTMQSLSGLAGSGASQTWNAAAGGLTISGVYAGSGTTVNNNGGRLTIDGAFDTIIGASNGRGNIAGTGGLTKNGSGTLTLGGTNANTYTGTTILNAGTIIAAKNNVFNGTGLTLNGGTFKTGGLGQSVGTLTLGGVTTLDLGAGSSAVTFGDSHSITWSGTLHILNWTSGSDTIRFGTSASSLTLSQLSDIVFDDIPGFWSTSIDSNGFITPVPEPSTITLSLLGGFGLAATLIWRRRK